jgi:threonine dehydratase
MPAARITLPHFSVYSTMNLPNSAGELRLTVIRKGAERIVEVTDHEIAEAIRTIYSATHNCAEGAGAAALAALIKERARLQGRRAGVILTGQKHRSPSQMPEPKPIGT